MKIGELFDRIYKGSMPRLYAAPNVDRGEYHESYLELSVLVSSGLVALILHTQTTP